MLFWSFINISLMIRLITSVLVVAAASLAKLDYPNKPGELEISYPFGLNEGCSLDEIFLITCNNNKVEKSNKVIVKSISIEYHEMCVSQLLAQDYYNQIGNYVKSNIANMLHAAMYTISNTKNKFTILGCDTFASLNWFQNGELESFSGCIPMCRSLSNVVNGSCSCIGCFKMAIPNGLKCMWVEVYRFYNHTFVWDFNLCGMILLWRKASSISPLII